MSEVKSLVIAIADLLRERGFFLSDDTWEKIEDLALTVEEQDSGTGGLSQEITYGDDLDLH